MFDLDAEVRRWWKHAEGKSSLSPCEVDELEDHLRARVDLELELDSAMTPAQAFALASEDVGGPAALSREFVRAGRPRWRRLLVAAWAMFAVSWFLPALVEYKPVAFSSGRHVSPACHFWLGRVRLGPLRLGRSRGLRQCTYQPADARDRSPGVPQTSIESALGRPPLGRRGSSQCAVLAVLGHERGGHGPATRLRGVGGFLRPGGHRPLAPCARMGVRPA